MSYCLKDYDFNLPDELIAQTPVTPRDSAKLLVYDRKKDKITHTLFNKILDFIPNDTQIILNDTKVIKARIYGKKASGGKVELLLQKPLELNRFLVNIRGKVKIDTKLFFDNSLIAIIKKLNSDGTREVEFYKGNQLLNFAQILDIFNDIGHIPLPPYIKREDTKSDSKDYQTIFAKKEGAVAAPTASLHFTSGLFNRLKNQFNTNYLTLHVGIGTFKPVEVNDIRDHHMHSEYYEIPNNTANIINSNKNILCIGTTVTRAVEYYTRTNLQTAECNLFLHPNNPPKRVNFLLTNFHLPKSTLIMLVSSFIGTKTTISIYKEAIKNRYRFFSYGDAMLIV